MYILMYPRLDGMTDSTPTGRSTIKRRNNFETPSAKASKAHMRSSPSDHKLSTPDAGLTSFADRPNPGQIIETLNAHIPAAETPTERSQEARVKLKANTELAKFAYKPMAMKLSEASEILDDRIDEFASIIQEHHGFPDSAFGNPAAQSTSEIIAVGRVGSDTDGRINAASLTLEASRRNGAGLRVPLRLDSIPFDFFPGKIVAVRGNNPSGEYFSVSEVITMPLLPIPASKPDEIDAHNARANGGSEKDRPLNILIGSGPYTPDADLSFSALHALLERAADSAADVLLLNGPFLDLEHPLIAAGDFELPSDFSIPPDRATIQDAFRAFISQPVSRLAEQNPGMTVILVPSVRDAVSKHVSWPQDKFQRRELGLPKQVVCVTNPITLSINELVVGIGSQDVLFEMQRQTVAQGMNKVSDDVLARLSANLINQRHFFPVFPPLAREQLSRPTAIPGVDDEEQRLPVGTTLDIAYLKLGEWLQVRPDLLITPSVLTPFAKVVESVLVVNPGSLSKKRGPGTFSQLSIVPRRLTDAESGHNVVGHELFNRARVDIVRI